MLAQIRCYHICQLIHNWEIPRYSSPIFVCVCCDSCILQ